MKRVLLGVVFASQVHSMNIETVDDAVVRLDTMIQSMETSLLSGATQELNDQIDDLGSVGIVGLHTDGTEGCSDCLDNLITFKVHLCKTLRQITSTYSRTFFDSVSMGFAAIHALESVQIGLWTIDNWDIQTAEFNSYESTINGKRLLDRVNDWLESNHLERVFTIDWLNAPGRNLNKDLGQVLSRILAIMKRAAA